MACLLLCGYFRRMVVIIESHDANMRPINQRNLRSHLSSLKLETSLDCVEPGVDIGA